MVIYRKEKINVKNVKSWAKIIGVLVISDGSLLMTLYKVKTLGSLRTRDFIDTESHWLFDSYMLILSCFLGSCF